MEWAPVYHVKGWGKFNRHYGDFCTGADSRAWEREDAQTFELEEKVPYWVTRKLLYLSGQVLNSRGDEFTRPTLREPSCERKGGMSFVYRVIHPATRDCTANERSVHFSNVSASVAAHESGNNGENTRIFVPSTPDFCTHRDM
jgi:hypothetical protein